LTPLYAKKAAAICDSRTEAENCVKNLIYSQNANKIPNSFDGIGIFSSFIPFKIRKSNAFFAIFIQ